MNLIPRGPEKEAIVFVCCWLNDWRLKEAIAHAFTCYYLDPQMSGNVISVLYRGNFIAEELNNEVYMAKFWRPSKDMQRTAESKHRIKRILSIKRALATLWKIPFSRYIYCKNTCIKPTPLLSGCRHLKWLALPLLKPFKNGQWKTDRSFQIVSNM